jgi:serine/threonine protein kinase
MPDDPQSVRLPVPLGSVVAGKYRLDRVIGAGGMGVVVAATQIELERHVALKFLLPEAAKDPDIVGRFSREARAAARIQGEHVARVLDVGVVEGGPPYLVMEYLEGADLSQRIAEARRLPLEEIAAYLLQACEALAEAHAAGIVHRDLKPANLFLAVRPDRSRMVKLLDFGISKAPVGAGAGVTSTQAIMGSPVYMSPEQLVSARQTDARADIWSLGVVLYEALVGIPPFEADTMPQIVTRILHTPAPRLAVSRPDLPPQVDAIVARCLEKEPSMRFADVAQLTVALAPFAADGARSVDRVMRVLGHASVPPPGPPSAMGAPPYSMQGPSPPMPGAMPPPMSPVRRGVDAWGATQAAIPRASRAPWFIALAVGLCAATGLSVVLVQRARRAELPAGPSSIVASIPGASVDTPPVQLAPPAESVAPAVVVAPPPAAEPTAPRPKAGGWRPAHASTSAAVASASAAPAPAPTPTTPPEPVDPLHMGIK